MCDCRVTGSASSQTACSVPPTLCQSQSLQGNWSPLHPGCPSLPLLLVWMNVYFLSPWCRTSLSFDFLSVLVVQGGTVCLPTLPSWFSSILDSELYLIALHSPFASSATLQKHQYSFLNHCHLQMIYFFLIWLSAVSKVWNQAHVASSFHSQWFSETTLVDSLWLWSGPFLSPSLAWGPLIWIQSLWPFNCIIKTSCKDLSSSGPETSAHPLGGRYTGEIHPDWHWTGCWAVNNDFYWLESKASKPLKLSRRLLNKQTKTVRLSNRDPSRWSATILTLITGLSAAGKLHRDILSQKKL